MQKVIFVAMESYKDALSFRLAVYEALRDSGIGAVNVTPTRLRTEYTYIYFIDVHDPRCRESIQGLLADAMFGYRDLRERLNDRTTDMTEFPECGLVEYVVDLHKRSELMNRAKVFLSHSGYGKPKYEPKCGYIDTDSVRKQMGVYQYIIDDIEMAKECAEKMWPKVNPFINPKIPEIKDVIFNPPATIVFWADGTKTVVQCQGDDEFDPEKGLAMAISKKMLGNKYEYYHVFKHWLKKYEKPKYYTPVTFTLPREINMNGSAFTEAVERLKKTLWGGELV